MFHMFEKIRGNGVYVIAEMSANHGGSIDVSPVEAGTAGYL